MLLNAEVGFTSDVIRDPKRFVGRQELIRDCVKGLNSPLGLICIYGKRGVGKSSLLRQLQQMANGDYSLATNAALHHLIPESPRSYYTVYYQCDAFVADANGLLSRLCNDQHPEDGLLRLVPDEGKQLVEFSRSNEGQVGVDLKLVSWGAKGTDASKYARVVPGDTVQSFRNFVDSIVDHNNKLWRKRDGVLILLDEFDVIQDKTGLGSLIKSMSNDRVKFAICGIARDLSELVIDHASVERLLEEGAIHVEPMSKSETKQIFSTAEKLFEGKIKFNPDVVEKISDLSEGYPYLAQLFGKACINAVNEQAAQEVDLKILERVIDDIRSGQAFPTLETAYQRAIGNSEPRQLLLTLLAEQKENVARFNDEARRVMLNRVRNVADDFDIQHVDQLIPRLLDKKYGPALVRDPDVRGAYQFENPVLRVYIKLRKL